MVMRVLVLQQDGRTPPSAASLLRASLPRAITGFDNICQKAENEDRDSRAGGEDDESKFESRQHDSAALGSAM